MTRLREWLALGGGDRSPGLNAGDRRVMWALTLVYTVLTLLNLGTLSFPRTEWEPEAGESITLSFDGGEAASVWINGNIGTGSLLFTAEDGKTFSYTQTYGEMFSWRKKPLGFRAGSVTLTVTSPDLRLNELAFFDGEARLLTVTAHGGEALFDEQSTVPNAPSYYNGMYFDEIYHARTAYEFLHGMSVYEWTHPPLGKLLIALGVLLFGMTPFGWRIVPALFGAGMLPLLFLLGKRLTERRDYAFLAAALFAVDTMHFAQTRIATVDVFIVFFILLMYLFMYDYLRRDFFGQPLKKALLPLGACGVSFGLGVAAKWTGLYAGAGLALLFFASLIRQGLACRADRDKRRQYGRRTVLTLLFCCGFFLLIPGCIYFVSYTPFYLYEAGRSPESYYGLGAALKTLIAQQESMFSYHSGLTATHSCQSAWYQWPFTAKSVWFYYSAGDRWISNISSTGNPAVWWVAAAGTLCLLVERLVGRMRITVTERPHALPLVLVGMAASYLPWTLVPRCTFQYHFFPTVPFIILAALLLLQKLEEERQCSPRLKWLWLGVAAVYFLLLFPAVSGLPMPKLYAEFLEHVLPGTLLFHGAL